MQLKYLLFVLILGYTSFVSAAIQATQLVQDTSITDDCVRIQLKKGNVIFAKINYQNAVIVTYTPCFPTGLPDKTVDLAEVEQITDKNGKFIFSKIDGAKRSQKIAQIGAIIAVLGGIGGTIGIQLFLIPTFAVTNLLLVLMTLIPLMGVITGLNSLMRSYRGHKFNKWYQRIAWIGTFFALTTLLISTFLLFIP